VLTVLAFQVVVTFFMYFAPTPGATGVAEGGYGLLFAQLVQRQDIALLTLTWRFLTILILGKPCYDICKWLVGNIIHADGSPDPVCLTRKGGSAWRCIVERKTVTCGTGAPTVPSIPAEATLSRATLNRNTGNAAANVR
jgi:hypothetical protein